MSNEIFMLAAAYHYGLISQERFIAEIAKLLKPGPLMQELMAQGATKKDVSGPDNTL